MARPPRGRKPSQPKPQQFHEFFKIYLPEHNSKALCIPPDFVKNFNGNIPKKATLNSLQGRSWDVELEKTGEKLLIKKGWERYVRDLYLARGDFLVFRYCGDSSFFVKVFGINGCIKDETTATLYQPRVKVEPKERSELVLADHTGNYEDMRLVLKRGDLAEKISQGEDLRETSERTHGSNKIRLTQVYDVWTPLTLVIPGRIIKDYNIDAPKLYLPETIKLRGFNGYSQSVLLSQRSDGRVEVKQVRWRELRFKHKISIGDECEFEFIFDEGRRIREVSLVQISSKTNNITRTRNSTLEYA